MASIDGLASGLDTTSIIDSLIKVEGNQQTLLKSKVSTTSSVVSLLTTLNTRLQSLSDTAKGLNTATAISKASATASSDAVTATAGSKAAAGTLSLTVQSLATRQTSVSAAMTSWTGGDTISFTTAGTTTDVDLTDVTNLDSVVSAINASDAGVRASKVYAGLDASGATQYKLQFSSRETGAAHAFEASTADGPLALTVATAASDATVTLWAGTDAATQVTSASNTFTGLLPDVDVTVAKVSTDPVTITVKDDVAAQKSSAATLFTSINAALDYIRTNTSVSTTTSTSGTSATSAGQLTGDTTIRSIQMAIQSAVQYPVDGISPSSIGISISSSGSITFDQTKFGAALEADPEKTRSMLAEISTRVQAAATAASDKYDGTLTKKIAGQNTLVSKMNEEISTWDDRLAARRKTLELQYANLETQLSKLTSQSNWLTSQLASLS